MRRWYQHGSVKKSRDGRYWLGQWRENDEQGIRRQRTRILGKLNKMSKGKALEMMAEIIRDVNARRGQPTGKLIDKAAPLSVGGFVDKVYLPFYERKWKQSTASTNRERIELHIVGAIGKRAFSSIEREDLQAFLDSKSTLSFSIVDHLRWDLRQLFAMAVAEGLIERNPAELLFTPKSCPRPVRRVMSIDEVILATSILSLRERVVVKLAILAGMRPGEIFALRRGDIGDGEISVDRRVYRGAIDTPKTDRSVRKIAVSAGLMVDLRLWLESSPGADGQAWLFPSEKLASPIWKDTMFYKCIKPVLAKASLGWVNFHVMRRTHSSLMRELGVDPKVVADQQGHTVDVNMNVYTATSMTLKAGAVEALESAMRGNRSSAVN